VINMSMDNRVLSLFTAFLALEPSDTVHACLECAEGSGDNGGNGSVGIEDEEPKTVSILKASPNPFENACTFTFTLPDDAGDNITFEIMNTLGQRVQSYSIDKTAGNNIYNIDWNGKDLNNNELAAGVYIAVLNYGNGRSIIKVVKQ
jgi:flagellar hook assembly protein FlgD